MWCVVCMYLMCNERDDVGEGAYVRAESNTQ